MTPEPDAPQPPITTEQLEQIRTLAGGYIRECSDDPPLTLGEQGLALAAAEWVYFRSPDWTWQNLCGRAGWMLWDPSTGEQFCFQLGIMS